MTTTHDLKQLAPTGKLRGGVVTAPAASAFFAIRDGKGELKGVTVDLIRSFSVALKLPLALQVYDNSGQVTDAVAKGECDVAFMPQDAERAKRVDFGPVYISLKALTWCRQGRRSKASTRSIVRVAGSLPSPTPRRRAVRAARRQAPTSRKSRASSR
jgi:polar amino acid transport system substrate-binding protein